MKKFILETDNWLKIPNPTVEHLESIQKIDSLLRKLKKVEKYPWFIDLKKKAFSDEIFYNWNIEDIIPIINKKDVDLCFAEKAKNYVGKCYNFMLNTKKISVDDIIILHDSVISNISKDLRKKEVAVGTSERDIIYYAPPHEKIEKLLNEFCNIANNFSVNTFFRCAYLHVIFVLIHPFEDGNGRIARLLTGRTRTGMIIDLSRFIMIEKNWYYQSLLNLSNENNFNDFITYILNRFESAYEKIIQRAINIIKYMAVHHINYTNLYEIEEMIRFDPNYIFKYYII